MSKQTVILFSYRRPEMTSMAIERLLKWPNLQRLVVSVDGPRVNASQQERDWRNETITRARELAERSSLVDVKAWDKNDGSSNHGFRAMSREFEFVDTIISLEEDNLITNEGLDFLSNQVTLSSKPLIASAYSKYNHGDNISGVRHTNFPEQWGISMNSSQFEFYKKVMRDKKVRIKKIRQMFHETFNTQSIYAELLSQYWFHHYNNMLAHADYGDGVISYSAVEAGVRYIAPWNSYVSDLGHLDSRGINPRTKISGSENHDVKHRIISDQVICLNCERNLNQMVGYGLRPIIGGYSFRLRNLLARTL